MNENYTWLLEGPSYLQYIVLTDLFFRKESATEVIAAREALHENAQVKTLVSELLHWPGPVLKRHSDSGHLLHKLTFIADLGFTVSEPFIHELSGRILSGQSKEGPFQILANVNPKYGGSGEDQQVWFLCDAPLVIYALARFGLKDDLRVRNAVNYLISLKRDSGWPCAVAPELGKFRGPGRKDDPCPYANLVMLKMLTQFPVYHQEEFVKKGVDVLLQLWQQRKERRPYLFAMGTDFAKLKAPLVWYDILHVLDVLTRFSWILQDDRLLEMVDIVQAKRNEQGRFIPESVFRPWKAWDFGQKKNPSAWISFLAYRILSRVEREESLN